METIARSRRTLAAAALLGLTTTLLLAPAPANAGRLPADPIVAVSVSAPTVAPAQGAQATNMRAALEDLRFDTSASSGC